MTTLLCHLPTDLSRRPDRNLLLYFQTPARQECSVSKHAWGACKILIKHEQCKKMKPSPNRIELSCTRRATLAESTSARCPNKSVGGRIPVEEVLAVPERDTVLQVMTAPGRLEAAIAYLPTATKQKVSSEHVETLGRNRHPEK